MEELKKRINDHLELGYGLEKFSKLMWVEIPSEKLEGFRDGLNWVLNEISKLEKQNGRI